MTLPGILLLALLAGNVLLRFFTNALGVLPRALNLWDVAVTALLVALALATTRPEGLQLDTGKVLRRLVAFNIVCLVGSLLNSSHIYWLAGVSQCIMWNEPILLFLAIVTLPLSHRDIGAFRRLLFVLVGLEALIGFLQVPASLRAGESEAIIGTFRGNAEQYQFFVLIGMFYLMARLRACERPKRWWLFGILSLLVLIVLIDNKASWIALACTLMLVVPELPALHEARSGRKKAYVLVAVLLGVGYVTVKLTSSTAGVKFGNLAEAVKSGNLLNLGKIKAMRDVLSAYTTYPQMSLVGSGLGTFYGRSSFQFFPFRLREMYRNETSVGSGEFVAGSASMAGVIEPVAGIEAFYRQFFEYDKIYAVGSGTADFPTSSYISLLGETGLVGTFLYLSVCLVGLRAARNQLRLLAGDADFLPFAATAYACLIYLAFMACYNYWLDCGRVNTIVWSLVGLTIRYASLRATEEVPCVVSSESGIASAVGVLPAAQAQVIPESPQRPTFTG